MKYKIKITDESEKKEINIGEDEIIEIKHEALSRKIFADGAIKAILYLKNQKAGLYTMKDVLNIK